MTEQLNAEGAKEGRQGRSARVPVRGTQSFVGVMATVWKRPSLTGIEVLWRWCFGVPLLAFGFWKSGITLENWQSYAVFFDVAFHGGFIFGVDRAFLHRLFPALLSLLIVWVALSATGRRVLLRRLEGRSHVAWLTIFLLGILRLLAFVLLLGLWGAGVARLEGLKLLTPLAGGIDPTYVPRFAGVVVLTLALFILWSLVSWVVKIAPILAAVQGMGPMKSLRAAFRIGMVRSKLIEINFVMGVVKVALLVLALVFSASPLPFSSVETPTFLACWWTGVAIWYFLVSDYFHVVGVAAYLTLFRAYEPALAIPLPPDGKAAS